MGATSRIRPSRPAAIAAATVAMVVVVVGAAARWRARAGADDPDLPAGTGVVTEVIDGDTVVVRLEAGEERVRLIGVDTPETVDPDRPSQCFGPEASARTLALLPPGTHVRLVRDREGRDQYGRLLAYVFREPDGVLVNQVLLEEGLGRLLTIAPNDAYQGQLTAAAARAEAAGRGLWSACPRGPPVPSTG